MFAQILLVVVGGDVCKKVVLIDTPKEKKRLRAWIPRGKGKYTYSDSEGVQERWHSNQPLPPSLPPSLCP